MYRGHLRIESYTEGGGRWVALLTVNYKHVGHQRINHWEAERQAKFKRFHGGYFSEINGGK